MDILGKITAVGLIISFFSCGVGLGARFQEHDECDNCSEDRGNANNIRESGFKSNFFVVLFFIDILLFILFLFTY